MISQSLELRTFCNQLPKKGEMPVSEVFLIPMQHLYQTTKLRSILQCTCSLLDIFCLKL